MLSLECSTSAHLQEAMCLQLAEDGCLLAGVLQGKRAHMVGSRQRARPPVQQGLALCRYDLALCPSTAAHLPAVACLSIATCMGPQRCDARSKGFHAAVSLSGVAFLESQKAELSIAVSTVSCVSIAALRMRQVKLWQGRHVTMPALPITPSTERLVTCL